MELNYTQGLQIAKSSNLESEYNACIADDLSPQEALEELLLISYVSY